jgi:hypothetical protein
MATLKPKEFIKSVLIDELGAMIELHPYMSFIIMGIGIEFLGKCIDINLKDWNVSGRSGPDFNNAIRSIPSLLKYDSYLISHDLYGSFRCGLAHAVAPKYNITLSSKDQMGHLKEENGRVNLKVENFYNDFKLACEYVMNIEYPTGDKMNTDFIEVPGNAFNSSTNIPTDIRPPNEMTINSSAASGMTTNYDFK